MFCISYRNVFRVLESRGPADFPSCPRRQKAEENRKFEQNYRVKEGGRRKISAEILYQNGHGHEHVRVDRQLQVLECRSV